MCGIGGCALRGNLPPDREALERMVAELAHRGPDDSGIATVGSVGLAHTRLAIVDPGSAGHQPMSRDGIWLTYNGEVFNHLELRDELGGRDWSGGSDTETLLEALREWGEDAIPRLNGLFAFAALDKARNRLLLARDRFGVKPLYWVRTPESIYFASEIRALLAAGVPRRVRRDILLHAVRHGWANGEATPIEGVRRVGSGSVVSIDLATLSCDERHWYTAAGAVDPELGERLDGLGHDDAVDLVESALRTSVHRRLMADVPVGTMCSGGIDSSLATAFAAERQPDILAFNAAVTDQPEADESRWARVAAEGIGVELTTVAMDARSWRERLVDVVRHVEYPLNHESSVPMSMIAEEARSSGIKVLLSGEGADELFGGYPWSAPSLLKDFAIRDRPLSRLARRVVRRSPRLRSAYTRLRGRLPPPVPAGAQQGSESPAVLAYEGDLAAAARRAYSHHPQGPRGELEANALTLLGSYLPHLLNRQDKTTMLASIETREPFLDPDLVSLALNLPLELKVEPRLKEVLREVGRRHLPAEIADRRKVGFGWSYDRYLLPAARGDFLIDGMLRDVHEASRERWREIVSSPGAWLLPLWTGEIWCRAVLDDQPTATIESDLWLAPGS